MANLHFQVRQIFFLCFLTLIYLSYTFQHNTQNFFICFFHSLFPDLSYATDGFSGFFLEDSGVWGIGLAVHGKMMGKVCCIKAGCDFGRAGDFGSVADNSRDIGEGVLDGLFDHRKISTYHISDSGTGCTGCGDCTAESGKFADVLFLIYS